MAKEKRFPMACHDHFLSVVSFSLPLPLPEKIKHLESYKVVPLNWRIPEHAKSVIP